MQALYPLFLAACNAKRSPFEFGFCALSCRLQSTSKGCQEYEQCHVIADGCEGCSPDLSLSNCLGRNHECGAGLIVFQQHRVL